MKHNASHYIYAIFFFYIVIATWSVLYRHVMNFRLPVFYENEFQQLCNTSDQPAQQQEIERTLKEGAVKKDER